MKFIIRSITISPIKTEKGEVYVNAKQMGKPFGKKPAKWLELPSTISLLDTLSRVRKSDTSEYQPIIREVESPFAGGGTWFHEDVAQEYAKQLLPWDRYART